MAFLLRRTRVGAYIYAIGDNPNGARVTGIPTRPIIVLQYVLAALIGCLAGLVLAASVNSMPTRIFNSTLIYDVILVVVLGGIGLSGGRGGVLNVVIGTLLIGTMLNGMTIMDVSYSGQNLVKGHGSAARGHRGFVPEPAQRRDGPAGRHLAERREKSAQSKEERMKRAFWTSCEIGGLRARRWPHRRARPRSRKRGSKSRFRRRSRPRSRARRSPSFPWR